MLGRAPVSLLWPDARRSPASLSETAVEDLQLGRILEAFILPDAAPGRRAARERFARDVVSRLLSDPEVIEHRQGILAELMAKPSLRQHLEECVPGLEA